MAFFAGIVLLVLTSSDSVLGQRKHSRNIQPVGADVKTGLNFDCPEEFGYYPHPADCTQYYVCVFGGALLESCTGGLMYSHELQTCDWPRNVGCDGAGDVATTPAVTYSSSSSRTPESKVRYTHPPPPPPPPQPAAVVTSRGQPRQLHHNQQELIKQKQQQQLYEDAEDTLPPAEEIESDRQQRVYRGQPSTVGQVQRDRDGLRHHTNAIPSSSGRGEKIGVISFGTQQQSLHQYSRDLTDDDDILTNSLTTKPHKRYKRQIKRSQDRGVEIDSWHVISNPYVKLQRPTSFQSPSLLGSTYRSSSLHNKHQPIKEFQNFQSATSTPLNINKGHSLHKNLENSNQFLSRPVNSDNYQYFSFQANTVPVLSELNRSLSNYSKYPHDDVSIAGNYERQVTPLPNHQQNANYFVPSIQFVLQSHKYKMDSGSESSLYLKAPELFSTTYNRAPTTTEINFLLHKQPDVFYNKRYQTIVPKEQNEGNSYQPHNYYNFFTYVPLKSGVKQFDIKQPEHNSSAKFKNFKETLPYNVQTYNDGNIQQSANSNLSKKFPENNSSKLYTKVKSQSQLQDSILEQSKSTKLSNSTLQVPRLTKLKNNLTQLNTTHTDDVYYYYYDDEGDRNKSKEMHSTHSSLSNSKQKTSPQVFPDNKYYYDEYYDYKDSNTTDYYDDEPNLSTGHYLNNSQAKHLDTSTQVTKYLLQPTTYSKIPTQSSITTLKSPTIQEIKEKITTTIPSIVGRIPTNSWLMSTTRPTTENVRQRLISTTHWYTNNDKPTNHHNVSDSRGESRSNRPVEQPRSTVAPKVVYNTSHSYDSSRYDPYYALYDDDVDLYKDVEYSQHYNNDPPTSQQTYRGTPASSSHQIYTQERTPKRGNAAYIQNSYSTPQDIYQSSVIPNYDDNHYSGQDDDRNTYHQTSKQTSRGDRNELNYIEESATTKRITTTTTTTTTVTTPRQLPTQKSTRAPARLPNSASANEVRAQPTHYTLPEGPGYFHANLMPNHTGIAPNIHEPSIYLVDNVSDISLQKPIVNQPAPFTFPKHLTTPKTSSFHYITKLSKSTSTVSTVPSSTFTNSKSTSNQYDNVPNNLNGKIIVPTTYSPANIFLKNLINTKLAISNTTLKSDYNLRQRNELVSSPSNTRIRKHPKLIKTLKLRVNASAINNQLWSSTNETTIANNLEIKDPFENISDAPYDKSISTSTELFGENDTSNTESFNENDTSNVDAFSDNDSSSTESFDPSRQSIYIATTTKSVNFPVNHVITTVSSNIYTPESFSLDVDLTNTSWLLLLERLNQMNDNKTTSRVKVSDDDINEPVIPKPLMDILHYETELLSLEKQNSYKSDPIEDVTKRIFNASRSTSLPTRVSRVNAAIKSVIALGGPQRQYTKCNDNQTPTVKCKKINQRVNSRGRGSAHYSSGPGDAVVVNRGTPPARSRPTLKPSTSIVSKAVEFIDIYKYPPQRPPPIYPQPQPDKTAAKCRKDVCLLPDCSCGGKEIPGDLDVEEVPQMVLLTFDDAVNDLNLPYYAELFENGRVNPNGCPIVATFYVSHEWTDYSQVQNLYADGHEMASHTVSHSFGEQFSQKKWTKEVAGQREILSAYGGVRLEDVRGMRAPFLSVGGNKMFKMLYDSNFTYDSSMPIYENKPPSWPYTLDYKLFHDCMIPPCPTRSYPGVWEVPMVMWQDLNGGRCSMGDACSNPPEAEGVFKMLMKNFERHYTTNRAPFGLFYHAAWFTQPHHKEGFIQFLDTINSMKDVWLLTNWQAIQWVRDPTPVSRLNSFQPFGCNYPERPKRCNNPKVCNLWHKTGVRYMRTCQPCPDIYPWTGNTGIRSSRIDNELED